MNPRQTWSYLKLVVGSLLLMLITACGHGAADDGGMGKLSMPLTSTAPSGVQYRLLDATFDISGPDSSTVSSEPAQASIELDVLPGSYTVTLRDGWSVQKLNNGDWSTVDAVLTSSPTVALDVIEGTVSEATFRFGIGEEFISFGHGRLSIGAEFDDGVRPPVKVTLAPVHSGWWNIVGRRSTGTGAALWVGSLDLYSYNTYFTFDRSAVAGEILDATLRVRVSELEPPGFTMPLSIWDVSTSAAALEADVNSYPTYADLQTGTQYGSASVDSTQVGSMIQIPLSDAAADINAATTTFSIGMHQVGSSPLRNEWVTLGFADADGNAELVLSVAQP